MTRLPALPQRVGGLGDNEMSIARGARRASTRRSSRLSSQKDNLVDAMASIIGHGLATRFPRLRFMPVEFSQRLDPAVLREAAAGL